MILGRLEIDTKGHLTLLRALARPELAALRCLVVGDGPDRARLETAIAELGLSERVELLGHSDNVANVLSMADLVVIASTNESSPNVILEAWAAHRPVVATTVGGIPELVEPGRNGLLVPPSDPEALATAIARLMGEPELRAAMARHGRELVEQRYSSQAMATSIAALYERLLTRAKLPQPPIGVVGETR